MLKLQADMKRTLVLFVLLSGMCQVSRGWAATITDNFDTGDDTAPPIAWSRYDPIFDATGGGVALGTWSFPEGKSYRLATQASPDPGMFGQARIGSFAPGNFADFYVAADIVNWDPTVHQVFGLLARVGSAGPGQTTGYLLDWDSSNPESETAGDMDIVRLEYELPTDLNSNAAFGEDSVHLVAGHSYRFVFMGVGGAFRGLVYDLTNTVVPIVDYGVIDPAYDPNGASHVTGTTGLLVANNAGTQDGPADATFDNFLATDGPLLSTTFPLLSVTKTAPGDVTLSWPINSPYTLQSSPSLVAPTWTAVSSTETNLARQVYRVSPLQGAEFFQLVPQPPE